MRSLWRYRRMALSGLVMVVAVRLGLNREEFAHLRSRLLAGTVVTRRRDDEIARRLLRTVTVAAGMVPGASCLTQALAGQVLLARHGLASDIVLGVRTDETGALKAHAWLYYDGRIALGGPPAATGGFAEIGSFRLHPQ